MNSKVLIAPDVGEEEFDHTYSDAAQYGRIQFWDDRYADESEPFEWYYPYQYFRQTILDNIALDGHVMIAGCGTSNMLEDMISDGFEDLVACDYSRVCISQMQIRCSDLPEITFFQGNMTDTDLPEESFDAIIDKALFDNMLCGDCGISHVKQYVVEVRRLDYANLTSPLDWPP
jgi:EEF1A lysine methyltransferase 4